VDYKFRKRGGQEGWAPTPGQMKRASRRFFPDSEFVDLAIPIKGAPKKPCPDEDHKGDLGQPRWEYWESGDGSHGWCCGKCGLVLQWG